MKSIFFEPLHNDYVIVFSISDSTLLFDLNGGIDTICRLDEEQKIEYNGNIVYEGNLKIESMPVLVIDYEISHLKKAD